jgi:diguanylate cyclase (GGDEF)-like protein
MALTDPATESGPTARDWRRGQVVADTYQRSKLAGFLYLFGWAVVALLGRVHDFAPGATFGIGLAFLALAMFRLRMRPPAEPDPDANRRWLRHYAWVLPLAPALWSTVQVWALLDPRFDGSTRLVALIATIGYATVFANLYSTLRTLAGVGVALLFLPMLVVLWADPVHRALAIAMSFYLLYLVGALLRSHAEYRRRLDLDLALREQRDLFQQLSRTDPLTGVFNRRHFSAKLDEAAMFAAAGGPAFSLLILDIDHFKRVNDQHGHAVGDACLVAVADRLQRAFPAPANLLARLGGEEFGVLIPGDAAVAAAVAETFRFDLAQRPLECEGRRLEVTASIGIGAFEPSRHHDGDGLYRAVDLALYAAKSQGRNRVQPARTVDA